MPVRNVAGRVAKANKDQAAKDAKVLERKHNAFANDGEI